MANKALMIRSLDLSENTVNSGGGDLYFFDLLSNLLNNVFELISSLLTTFLVICVIYIVFKMLVLSRGGNGKEAVAAVTTDIKKVFEFFLGILSAIWNWVLNVFVFFKKNKLVMGVVVGLVIVLIIVSKYNLVQVMRIQSGQKGVDTISGKVLDPGTYVISPLKSNYVISHVANYQFDIVEITADSKELQDVVMDVNLTFHLKEEKLVDFYQREGLVSIWDVSDSIVTPRVVEKIKNVVKNYSFKEVTQKQIEVKESVIKEIKVVLDPLGIEVDDLNIVNIRISSDLVKTLGERDILDEKMEIAEKELKIAEQEKAKKVIEAQGIAESNREISSQQITAEMLELKKIENTAQAIEQWDGKMPNQVGGNFSLSE
ncbi:MAG: hypothetical protein KAT32_02785 [Candidatus Moranbacteria bacterium]|nr:hypothetical protein [Candidatus Moranbacteria bacterium]